MNGALNRFLADRQGGPAFELALVFPVFVFLLLSVVWMALLLWTENGIQFAANAAARCATIDTTACGTVAAIQDAAIGWAGGVPIARADVTVNLATNCTAGVPGNAVTIQYTATYFLLSTTAKAQACFPTGS